MSMHGITTCSVHVTTYHLYKLCVALLCVTSATSRRMRLPRNVISRDTATPVSGSNATARHAHARVALLWKMLDDPNAMYTLGSFLSNSTTECADRCRHQVDPICRGFNFRVYATNNTATCQMMSLGLPYNQTFMMDAYRTGLFYKMTCDTGYSGLHCNETMTTGNVTAQTAAPVTNATPSSESESSGETSAEAISEAMRVFVRRHPRSPRQSSLVRNLRTNTSAHRLLSVDVLPEQYNLNGSTSDRTVATTRLQRPRVSQML